MPTSEEFLNGYDFIVNKFSLGNWVLRERYAEHHVVKIWNEYTYPIQLLFQTKTTNQEFDSLLADISNHVKKIRVIRTESGRPYKCQIHEFEIISQGSDYVVIEMQGYAKRIGNKEAGTLE